MKIHNKVFVVTGAGGGIGSELVYALQAKGAHVAAIDLRQESLAKLQVSTNSTLTTYAIDITDRSAVSKLPSQIIKDHGAVDAIINCAGIIQPFVKINDLNFDAIEKVMNVNFYGTLNITKAFLPQLLQRPEAYILNFSSMGGFLPVPGQGIYGASKAAVKLLTEALYAELLHSNVHVSVVFPGATATEITQNSGVDVMIQPKDGAKHQNIPMLSAAKVAELVIKGIEKNQPQIYTGKDATFMNKLYRINPIFATKFITKKMASILN